MRRTTALLGLLASTLAAACGSDAKEYVHVYVQGSGNALTSQPFELQVTAFSQGKRSDLVFGASLHGPDGPASRPYADFLLDVAGGTKNLDLRVVTKGALDNVEWGGDAHLSSPKGGSVLITLTRGESRVVPDEIVSLLDGVGENATLFAGGIALAWVDRNGVRELAIDPDRPVGRGRIVCATCKDTKALRIASRPLSPFGSDLYALSWIDAGKVSLKTTTRSEPDKPVVDVPSATGNPASEIRVAGLRKGGAADVVLVRLEGGDVVLSLHDASGNVLGTPFTGVTGAKERSLVGVVTALDDSITIGVRGASSRLVRLGANGAKLGEATVDGDLRALSLSADGNRILVAASRSASASAANLDLAVYSAGNLARGGDPTPVSSRAVPPGVSLSHVSLASCALAWAEPRDDGGDDVDVRVQRIDENGSTSGAPTFANVGPKGRWLAPTTVCASATRAFATFFDRASEQTGNLWFRRLP